jgi:serine phosphatase RsbU (regulator of sigma subunit)
MLAGASLNRIFGVQGAPSPATILRDMNRLIRQTLSRDGENPLADDGLDMAVCQVRDRKLTFAGARFSLFHAQGGKVTEIKGDVASIGYRTSDPEHVFQEHGIALTGESAFYLASDGLFGQMGAGRLPFGKKRLCEFIASHGGDSMEAQHSALAARLAQHRGEEPQRDDITVIGFRLNPGTAADPRPNRV